MKRLLLEALGDRWCPSGTHTHPEPEPELPLTPPEAPALEAPSAPPVFVGPLPEPPVVATPTPVEAPTVVPVVPIAEPNEHHEEDEHTPERRAERLSLDGVSVHQHHGMGTALPTGTLGPMPHSGGHPPDHESEHDHEPAHEPHHIQAHPNGNSAGCGHGPATLFYVTVHTRFDHFTVDDEATEPHDEPTHRLPTESHTMPEVHYEPNFMLLTNAAEVLVPTDPCIDLLPVADVVAEAFHTFETVPTNRLQRLLGWCSLSVFLLWCARTMQDKPLRSPVAYATK